MTINITSFDSSKPQYGTYQEQDLTQGINKIWNIDMWFDNDNKYYLIWLYLKCFQLTRHNLPSTLPPPSPKNLVKKFHLDWKCLTCQTIMNIYMPAESKTKIQSSWKLIWSWRFLEKGKGEVEEEESSWKTTADVHLKLMKHCMLANQN